MFIQILGWIMIWLLSGFVAQILLRVADGDSIFSGGQYYFWSAIFGFIAAVMLVYFIIDEKLTSNES